MTLREALVMAVDFMRSSGSEQQGLGTAARILEGKAERLRVLAERRLGDDNWCECGEPKSEQRMFCEACCSSFPVGLWFRFHAGDRKQSMNAQREMRRRSRWRREREEAA